MKLLRSWAFLDDDGRRQVAISAAARGMSDVEIAATARISLAEVHRVLPLPLPPVPGPVPEPEPEPASDLAPAFELAPDSTPADRPTPSGPVIERPAPLRRATDPAVATVRRRKTAPAASPLVACQPDDPAAQPIGFSSRGVRSHVRPA